MEVEAREKAIQIEKYVWLHKKFFIARNHPEDKHIYKLPNLTTANNKNTHILLETPPTKLPHSDSYTEKHTHSEQNTNRHLKSKTIINPKTGSKKDIAEAILKTRLYKAKRLKLVGKNVLNKPREFSPAQKEYGTYQSSPMRLTKNTKNLCKLQRYNANIVRKNAVQELQKILDTQKNYSIERKTNHDSLLFRFNNVMELPNPNISIIRNNRSTNENYSTNIEFTMRTVKITELKLTDKLKSESRLNNLAKNMQCKIEIKTPEIIKPKRKVVYQRQNTDF